MSEDKVDLLDAFSSGEGFQDTMNNLLGALDNTKSASAAILALQALYNIEDKVESGQFKAIFDKKIRAFLRKWRCESPLSEAYSEASGRVVPFLRNLSIFETLKVPLFIDDYGKKRIMSEYGQGVVLIDITLQTPIVHVTHEEEKDLIMADRKFIPSKNKNIIAGTWFSPKNQLGSPPRSVYGSWAFETTLEKLGVECIRQGEIVSYKNEVNFILYAGKKDAEDEDERAVHLRKATDEAAIKIQRRLTAYTGVSVFVPSTFLPVQAPQSKTKPSPFENVITGPFRVSHNPFCVRSRRRCRRRHNECQELD